MRPVTTVADVRTVSGMRWAGRSLEINRAFASPNAAIAFSQVTEENLWRPSLTARQSSRFFR